MISTIDVAVKAPDSNVEAGDVAAVDWNQEAEAWVEEFEQPHVSCSLIWDFAYSDAR